MELMSKKFPLLSIMQIKHLSNFNVYPLLRQLTGSLLLIFTTGNLMAAEPIKYSIEDQYVDILEADVIFIGSIQSMDTSKPVKERGDPGVTGPSRNVRAKIKIHHVIRGEVDTPEIEYMYKLYFNLKPTFKKGDSGIFFFKRRMTEEGQWQYSAAYLVEDNFAPMNDLGSLEGMDKIDVLVALVDENGKPLYHKTVSEDTLEPDQVTDLLGSLNIPDRGNAVCLFKKCDDARTYVQGSVFLRQRWPY